MFRRYAIVNETQKAEALNAVAQRQQVEDERKAQAAGTRRIQ